MPHGESWFSLIPGYESLLRFFRDILGESWIVSKPIVIQHILAGMLVLLFATFLSIYVRRRLKRIEKVLIPPSKLNPLSFFEILVEMLLSQMRQIIGKEAERFLPFIGTLGVFILFSNLLGLIPGFLPPTQNLNNNAACAILVFAYYHWIGLKKNKLKYIKHLANPMGVGWGWFMSPFMFPIEMIGHLARPLSLSLRLMGNIFGDHAVLLIFLSIMPIVVPLPFMFLGLLVACVQTVIFCLLSIVYISVALGEEHE
jgi:F-type H+-transporting ATPase subunit a